MEERLDRHEPVCVTALEAEGLRRYTMNKTARRMDFFDSQEALCLADASRLDAPSNQRSYLESPWLCNLYIFWLPAPMHRGLGKCTPRRDGMASMP